MIWLFRISLHAIFIEETYTGFLLMFKRRDLLKFHKRSNKLPAIVAEIFMAFVKKGSQFSGMAKCILK
jgi:hypothetical protein